MKRRTFLGTALAFAAGSPLSFAQPRGRWDDAAEVLERATAAKQVDAAVLHVVQKKESFTRHFGKAASGDAMFLLGSISKPINVTAVMTLFDQGKFRLDDRVKKFLPAFTGDGRDAVTDPPPADARLRPARSAGQEQRAAQAARAAEGVRRRRRFGTRLDFAPGTRYQYSSMGILLAARIAELISGSDILTLVDRTVFQPLGMKHSAQGLGRFKLEEMVSCQMEGAAPESGGGDPKAKEWDWNSPYWRKLGAPWGGTHASAPDVAAVPGRVPGGARQGREARDGAADDQEPQPGGTHPARAGVRRRQGVRQSRVFGADLRPYRLDGHALLGRPRERNHLRRAHVAAAPRRRNPTRATSRRSASRRRPAADRRGDPDVRRGRRPEEALTNFPGLVISRRGFPRGRNPDHTEKRP